MAQTLSLGGTYVYLYPDEDFFTRSIVRVSATCSSARTPAGRLPDPTSGS